MVVRAVVTKGRVTIDEAVDLPDGTEVFVDIDTVVDGETGELEPEDQARLEAALDAALERMKRGEPGISADKVVATLRARG